MNMKTKLSLFAVLALVFGLNVGTTQEAHAQLGVAAGLNFENPGDVNIGGGVEGTFDNSTGYHIGLFYDLAVGPVAIRPGVFYRHAGDIDYTQEGGPDVELPDDFDLSLVEVPIDVRFRMATPVVKPYLLAGPVFSFPSSGDDRFDDGLESMYVSGSVGAGLEVAVPVVGIRLFPEIRYAFGLNSFIKDDANFFGTDIEAEDSSKLNAFMIRLGVGL